MTEPSCKPFETSDPVTYGRIDVSSVNGDASGVDFTFQVVDTVLSGWVRDARGEVPPPRALRDVQYDAETDSLTFWYDSGSGTRYLYSFRAACDSIWGRARLFVTDANPEGMVRIMTLHRSAPSSSVRSN